MNTRKALGIFAGVDAGDTFLSDPRAVERFSRAAAARQEGILRKQQQPQVSQPHARLAAEVANEALRTSMLNSTAPLVDKFSAYQTAKKYASQTGADGGLRALAQHMRVQWEGDRDGFFSAADLVRIREHFSKSFGRTAAIDVLSNAIPRAGVGDLPVRRLQQYASQIRHQADYEAICRQAGLDGSRPDQVRARAYLRALVRRAAEGEDGANMDPAVIEQQGAQLSGIPADDGGGVLSGADLQIGQNHARAGSLPTEKQVTAAVLDANVVKIAGYSIFVNDADQVELRTPRGTSRQASISHLSFVVRDFLKLAQAANFEPSVNSQQDPYVNISETEGGDVLGKDSTSDDKATDAITLSGKPKAQHPAQDQAGTSVGDKPLGDDSAGKDPTWGNPTLSGAHASDPHDQSGTSFSDRNLGADHQQDTPGWEDPGPIQTSRKGSLDDSAFIAGGDPAERYRRARQDRPSARLLAGIGDEEGWLSRRVLAQMEGGDANTGKGDEAQTPVISDVAKEAARSPVCLREDVFQIGDGFQDRQADSRLVYTFAYDQKVGQPRVSEMQRYIDKCCGDVRAYHVASVSQVSPGVVRAIVIEAQSEMPPMFGGDSGVAGEGEGEEPDPEAKREAVRIAMGKVTAIDHGNDPEGMGSNYQGTVLNKEGAGKYCEKCKVTHREKTQCPHANKGPENKPRYEEPALPPAGEVRSPYDKPETLPTKKNLGTPTLKGNSPEAIDLWHSLGSFSMGLADEEGALGETYRALMDKQPVSSSDLQGAAKQLRGLNFGSSSRGNDHAKERDALAKQCEDLAGKLSKGDWSGSENHAEKVNAAVVPLLQKAMGGKELDPKQVESLTNSVNAVFADANKKGGVINREWLCRALDSVLNPMHSFDKKIFHKAFDAQNKVIDALTQAGLVEEGDSWNRLQMPGTKPQKRGAVDDVSSVGSAQALKEGTQKAVKPVKDVPSFPAQGQPKQGARISEGWGEGGEYKREIDAESAQEVWELHRGLGGEAPDFKALQQLQQQRQQQEAQSSTPVEPRPDASGQVRLPEPEPETMNAEQELPPQQPVQQQVPQQARQAQQSAQTTFCEECGKTFTVPPGQSLADAALCEDCDRQKYDEESERTQDSQSWGQY